VLSTELVDADPVTAHPARHACQLGRSPTSGEPFFFVSFCFLLFVFFKEIFFFKSEHLSNFNIKIKKKSLIKILNIFQI
jgi:hypothetical protein